MNEWEAKYHVLAAEASMESVNVAEAMVQKAIDISYATTLPPWAVIHMMWATVEKLETRKKNNLDLLGLDLSEL